MIRQRFFSLTCSSCMFKQGYLKSRTIFMDLLKVVEIECIYLIYDSFTFCPAIFGELVFASFLILQSSINWSREIDCLSAIFIVILRNRKYHICTKLFPLKICPRKLNNPCICSFQSGSKTLKNSHCKLMSLTFYSSVKGFFTSKKDNR